MELYGKRGGTIRDLAVEYLNSLFQPIAPLTDICDYIAKFREDVKESSVKANLLAEANNRFSLYYKGDVLHIGFTDTNYGEEYVMQEKRQGRRPFKTVSIVWSSLSRKTTDSRSRLAWKVKRLA